MGSISEVCGLIGSFFGTFIEGEFLLLTSIISAKMGEFNFFVGMFAAFLGAYTKDMIKFTIVKKKGRNLVEKKPKLKNKLDNASGWFEKRPFLYLSIYRLMYGFGTVILMLSGLKDISFRRFALHSAISVGLWILVIGGLGYFCAELMLEKLNLLSEYKYELIGALAVIGLAYWFFVKRPKDKYCYTEKETTLAL